MDHGSVSGDKRKELTEAVATLRALLDQSASHSLIDQRKGIIDRRRQIASQNDRIADLGHTVFSQDVRREVFGVEMSALRKAAADHRADWPVVAIDPDNEAYSASLARLRAAYKRFMAWMEKAITE